MNLIFLGRHFVSGFDMNQRDYDGRTILHIAGLFFRCQNNFLTFNFFCLASEGNAEIVNFLQNTCRIDPDIKDRYFLTMGNLFSNN